MATTTRPSLVMFPSPRMSLQPPHTSSEGASGTCNNVHCGKTNQVDTLQKTTKQSHNGEGGAAMSVHVQIRQQMLLLWCYYCYHVEVICATTTTCIAAIETIIFKLLFLMKL